MGIAFDLSRSLASAAGVAGVAVMAVLPVMAEPAVLTCSLSVLSERWRLQ